jgi:nitrite reductase/ring-hydroxylating ferredoxin subunit
MAAADGRQAICRSRELLDGKRGVRFQVWRHGEQVPAFVVRFQGRVHAYLNRCAHRSLELDWNEGDFFDAFGELLLCATQGARYAPASGTCVGGPCGRAGLVKLAVFEENGDVCLEAGNNIHLVTIDGIT